MADRQKRILAVHDISGVGKCSLTVALPIISAAGVECACLPTAVLSTHTGGFTGFTYRDLTADIAPITEHWASLGVRFDGIYSGFLGSLEQIDLVAALYEKLKTEETVVVVDPVMADGGQLYAIFDKDYPKAMRSLCEKADVLLPNVTEACLLVDEAYREPPYTKEYVEGLLAKLAALGPKRVVLTGAAFTADELGAAIYDHGRVSYAMAGKIEGYYHGTGDVFGSVAAAGLARGLDLERAARAAVDFTVAAIRRTKDADTERRYGVNFEAGLAGLAAML